MWFFNNPWGPTAIEVQRTRAGRCWPSRASAGRTTGRLRLFLVELGLLEALDSPPGKWPHMITEWLHRLRSRLAVALAASVGLSSARPESAG